MKIPGNDETLFGTIWGHPPGHMQKIKGKKVMNNICYSLHHFTLFIKKHKTNKHKTDHS